MIDDAEVEWAHQAAVRAATEGLQDAALGALRLEGEGVNELAEAAVTSATPFLLAPLLGTIERVRWLHRSEVGPGHGRRCIACGHLFPCATRLVLDPGT